MIKVVFSREEEGRRRRCFEEKISEKKIEEKLVYNVRKCRI